MFGWAIGEKSGMGTASGVKVSDVILEKENEK